MNASEIRAELQKVRGEQVVEYSCECCGTGYTFELDKDGEYVRWSDIEKLLEYVERDQQ